MCILFSAALLTPSSTKDMFLTRFSFAFQTYTSHDQHLNLLASTRGPIHALENKEQLFFVLWLGLGRVKSIPPSVGR